MKKYKSNHCKNTTAVILAGGRGRRVGGKDKGLLIWGKEPLIQHIYKRIKPQVNQVIVSCNRNFDQYKNLVDVFVSGKILSHELLVCSINFEDILLKFCFV